MTKRKSNHMAIVIELQNRDKAAQKRGGYENGADTLRRILFYLGRSFSTTDGKRWTMRSYLIKNNMSEYKRILECIRRYYTGKTFANCSRVNLNIEMRDLRPFEA